MSSNKINIYPIPVKTLRCLSCGTDRIKPGRRYCTKECREQINWVLSLSKGLLKAFNARYAAFCFTQRHVILDMLPVWSNKISRFNHRREPGNKPAEDLKNLILRYGEEWHHMVNSNNSQSYSSFFIIEKNNQEHISPASIKPNKKALPRLSKAENNHLKVLKLKREDLSSDAHAVKIKSAYKKLAKIHHPDMGGDEESFKRLNEAHAQMLLWAENPQYTSRKALQDLWSYDGSANRWSPPL